jgi:hypothetical protein
LYDFSAEKRISNKLDVAHVRSALARTWEINRIQWFPPNMNPTASLRSGCGLRSSLVAHDRKMF